MDRRALHQQFLQQFPIERLGTMTLEEYTNLNREDSFCYWLEVKTQELGSIWGGTSYKFGIYQYEKKPNNPLVIVSDEKYAWYKKFESLDRTEAFKVVLKAIVGIAESAAKGDFETIEEDDTFGTVVKWKIAFLYANEALLPFYKREMLETLASEFGHPNPSKAKIYELQHFLMTQKGDKDLYDFCEELLSIIKQSQSNDKKYWMYAPGRNGSKWERCQEQGIICIGWDILGDLSQINSLEDCRDKLKNIYNAPNSSFINDGLAVWEFSHVMQPGDIVYAKQGQNNIIARGIVKSEYRFDPTQEDYYHTREVEWTHIGNWEMENLVLKTLTDITKYPDYVKKIESMITEGVNIAKQITQYNENYLYYINLLLKNRNLILNGAPGTGKTYLAKLVAAQIIYEGNVPKGFEEDTNFIEQCGFVQFHPSYDYTDFVEGLRPKNDNGNIGFERKDGTFKEFCAIALQNLLDSKKTVQALQNELSVRDLLEGFIEDSMDNGTKFETSGTKNEFYIIDNKEKSIIVRIPANEKTSEISLPKSDLITLLENKVSIQGGGDIQIYFGRKHRTQADSYIYVLYDALVKNAVPTTKTKSVAPVPEKNFVFIIDEINRGEISKIFGELFFSIDPGYRGVKGKVQTQYQNLITEDDPFKDGFYIPENVYIIGTMNDIDRSVECMDFAMRRRFTFKEITAEESGVNMGLSDEATKRMQSLNKAISEIEGFNSSFHIGAAYYISVTDYKELWNLKLQGLLKEYLRGMPDAEETLKTLKKAYELSSQDDNN